MWRREVRPFTDKQIELVKTWADQAAIAIENVRLFTELEARNRDLAEALDQRTATSRVLEVISSSPTDVRLGLLIRRSKIGVLECTASSVRLSSARC
jgi:hypothetical protein